MRVAVVGMGSAGSRSGEHLHQLGCDVVPVRRDQAIPGDVAAIVVATPTHLHREALAWAVDHGVHAYVEKPIADTSTGMRELLERGDAAGIVVATGYNLRFHPALETIREAFASGHAGRLLFGRAEVGQYLPDWHPKEDYRSSYAARADGGGALLTLSHELDLVRWIAGEIVSCRGVARRVSSLELAADDVGELVCEHESGALTSVHVDFLDRSYNRRSRWIGEEATIAWSWDGDVVRLPAGEELWRADGFDAQDTYRLALADFLHAIDGDGRPRCDGWDGLRVLELCEEALR